MNDGCGCVDGENVGGGADGGNVCYGGGRVFLVGPVVLLVVVI